MADKRTWLRQLVKAPVKLSHSTFGEFTAVTGDISNSGVFVCVDTTPPLPKGAHIKLQFPKSVYPSVSFNARVVRMTKDGYGLEFVDYEHEGKRFPIENLKLIWNKNA